MFALTRQDTTAIKGIAICAMLCHHLYGFPPEGVETYTGVLAWLGVLGKVCVTLFLFCSGYGLAANYSPTSFKDDLKFIGRRLVKFYLNYWVIFLIFVPITVFCFNRPLNAAYGENYVWGHLLLDIFGLRGWQSYNITWWFNTLIIILYLLFPILYRLIRIKPWIAVLVGMVVMRLSTRVPFDTLDLCLWQFPFILGIVWKLYADKGSRIQEWLASHRAIAVIGSIGLLIVTIIIRMYPIIPHWSGMRIDGFISCSVALCVVTIVRHLNWSMETFAFLGEHSMNIYMMHTFINAFWCKEWLHTCAWMRQGANFVVLLIICLTISVCIEYIKKKSGYYKFVNNLLVLI